MRNILLFTFILAGGLSTANAGKAVLIKLVRNQWSDKDDRPDGEYCMVCEDVEDGSKMKLKLCDDPYQDNTKLWMIDGKYIKSYRDPSLCVEATNIGNNEMPYLESCDGSSKQRWKLPEIGRWGQIKPKRSDSYNVAFESIGDGPGGSAASPGDKIVLVTWEDPDWVITPFDVDDDDDSDDDSYRIGPCRQFQLEENEDFCMEIDYPVTSGRRVVLERCSENAMDQMFCPDTLGRFHAKEDLDLCLRVGSDNEISLGRCRGYFNEQFDRVTARSSYPSSDALFPSMDSGSCVTYAGDRWQPREGRSIVTKERCSTQWIHYQPPPDIKDCRQTKLRLRGSGQCIGAVNNYVFEDDGLAELMSCGRDETRFCLLKSGQVQALEAFMEGTRNGYFESHADEDLLLQNAHDGSSQTIRFRSNGKIKTGIGQCLTTDSHWNPREGDRVMSKRCRVGLKWDVVSPDNDDDDDPKYTICKFKLKKSGSLCAGNVDNDELHLMSCDDDDTRMKWGRNGLIQSTAGGDTYWESCSGSRSGSPPSNCQVILQNRADNGEQEFVLSGSDLILKGNTDACVTYEGNYPNAGDRLYLEDCDDVTNTRWVAKCDD